MGTTYRTKRLMVDPDQRLEKESIDWKTSQQGRRNRSSQLQNQSQKLGPCPAVKESKSGSVGSEP